MTSTTIVVMGRNKGHHDRDAEEETRRDQARREDRQVTQRETLAEDTAASPLMSH